MGQFVETMTQTWFWRYFFSHFGWVDWLLLAFLLIGIMLGLKHGMAQELPRVFEMIISLYLSLEYQPVLTEWLVRETPCPEAYAQPLTFGLIGFLSWFALRFLFEILGRFIRLEVAAPFQLLGGLIAGGARYFLFFAMISYFLVLVPLDWIQQSFRVQSWSGQILTQAPPKIHDWIKEVVVRKVQA